MTAFDEKIVDNSLARLSFMVRDLELILIHKFECLGASTNWDLTGEVRLFYVGIGFFPSK